MQRLTCFKGDLSLYTKEAARMKNRKDISREQAVKMSRRDFMSAVAAVAEVIEAYCICDNF
jgi:hypothetical protein